MHIATTTPERVDEEIIKCLVLLSDLRAQKNSFLPIFRLPPETLANVFIYVAHKAWDDDNSTSCVPLWINVSYVCRHWRNVALDCPMLWTYHFTASSRWTEELLARSKQALLKIRITQHYRTGSWWSRLVANVLSQAGRIQELRLRVQYDLLPIELPSNAPHLKILDIMVQRRPPLQDSDFVIKDGATLPLHTLKLTNSLLPWHSTFNLSGVTTLSLCRVPRLSQQDIVDFLPILNRMQALTVLQLEDALRGPPDPLAGGASGISTKVNLLRLSRLLVHAPLSTVLVLLSGVNFPSDTHVGLQIDEETYDPCSDDEYAQLLPSVVAHRFSRSETLSFSSPAICSLAIHFSTYALQFTFSTLERSDCGANLVRPYPPQTSDIPLFLHVPRVMRNRDRIANDICCSIPSTHIQTLHVLQPPSPPDFWRKTLGHLDKLQYMKLSNGHMPDLVSLLSLPADVPVDAQTPGHAFLPALKELELYFIRFFSKDSQVSQSTVSYQSLLDALSTRKELNLTVIQCNLWPDKYGTICECTDQCHLFKHSRLVN